MEFLILQYLLAEIEAGRVEILVVYKIDRPSRSLLDLVCMIEFFNKRHISLVMTLNILITFPQQYERIPLNKYGHGPVVSGKVLQLSDFVTGTHPASVLFLHTRKGEPHTREGYQECVSDPVHCRQCELHGQCTTSRNCVKGVTRHIWQEYKEEINEHRYEDRGKQVYKRRKETVERSFADGKELHGHRYARFRGRHRVQMQYLLSAACQNMKKIALLVWRDLTGDGQRLAQRCLNTVSPWQRQIFPAALAA